MLKYKSRGYFVTERRREGREVKRCVLSTPWGLHRGGKDALRSVPEEVLQTHASYQFDLCQRLVIVSPVEDSQCED